MRPQLKVFVCAVQILVLEFSYSVTATAETNDSTLLFFYSPVLDYCGWGDTSFSAPNNTANGGVCAYLPAKSQLYACPATARYVYSTSRCMIPLDESSIYSYWFFYVAIVGRRRWTYVVQVLLIQERSRDTPPALIKSSVANPRTTYTSTHMYGAATATTCARTKALMLEQLAAIACSSHHSRGKSRLMR